MFDRLVALGIPSQFLSVVGVLLAVVLLLLGARCLSKRWRARRQYRVLDDRVVYRGKLFCGPELERGRKSLVKLLGSEVVVQMNSPIESIIEVVQLPTSKSVSSDFLRRKVDFVAWDVVTLKPLLVIDVGELDSEAELRPDSMKSAFKSAGVGFFRLTQLELLDEVLLESRLWDYLPAIKQSRKGCSTSAQKVIHSTEGVCPRCGSKRVSRRIKSGSHAGRLAWVCVNYPDCRSVALRR